MFTSAFCKILVQAILFANCTVYAFILSDIRVVIDKFVSFFHKIIIYEWIYIIFCRYQQQSVVSRKKTLKCKVWQICDVTMTLMTSHVGDVVMKRLKIDVSAVLYMAINAFLQVRLL